MNRKEKEIIIGKFIAMKRKGLMLEIDLYFRGMDNDAEKIGAKISSLSPKIDHLLTGIMKDWIDDTAYGVVEKLKHINSKMRNTVHDVKKDIEIAKNTVKALGYLDETIKLAADLLA